MNKLCSEAKEFALASVPFAALAKKNNIDIGVCPTYLPPCRGGQAARPGGGGP